MTPRRREPPREPARGGPDDEWLKLLRAECARAIVGWLKNGVNTQRPIRSLTMQEMEAMAEACTARWIVLASERAQHQPADERDADEIAMLLLG